MVEAMGRVVPAAVAAVPVDDPVGGGELVGGVGEAADEDDGAAGGPGEPGEAAGKADEDGGVAEPVGALSEGAVAGLVFGAVGDVGPHEAGAVHGLLVDADHAEAAGFEVGDGVAPAGRVVPVFAAAAALDGNDGVGLGDGGRGVRQGKAGWGFGGVDAEDVGGGFAEADVAEVGRLPFAGGVVEEEADGVGGVGGFGQALGFDLLVGDEAECGVGGGEEGDDEGGEGAGDAGGRVAGGKADGVGEPGEDVAEGADGEEDQDFLPGKVERVGEDEVFGAAGGDVPDVEAEADEPALGGADEGAGVVAGEENVAGVEVAEADAPLAGFAGREGNAGALVEVEADAGGAGLGGDGGGRGEGGFGGGPGGG